jgi:hypothetical protein
VRCESDVSSAEKNVAHEDLGRTQHVEGSSNRSFGLVFASVFLIVMAWPLFYGESPRWWALAVSIVFAAIALLKPVLLGGLNRLWTKLGLLLGAIVSPIALGVLFYGILTPLAVLSRLTGNDPLRLRRDATVKSYWISREPPGPPPDSMTKQF